MAVLRKCAQLLILNLKWEFKIRVTDLDKLNLDMAVWFYAQAYFDSAPAASKNDTDFISGQKHTKIILFRLSKL